MGTVTYKKTTYMLIVLEEGSIYKLGGETFEFTGEYDYVYDALGRTTSETLKNGSTSIITKTFTYLDNTNSTNLIESEEFSNGSIYTYEYDALNRLTAVKENGTIKLKYTYDAMSRLAREDNAYANKTYVYEYTTNGNISAKKTYAYTSGTLGAVQSTETRAYGNSNWIDQLTNINGTTITYDGMGNPLNWHNASALDWEGRKLKTFTKTDGTAISYTYNGDGIRTGKTVGSERVEYLLDGTSIIREIRDDYTLTFLYDDGTLVGFNYNNGTSNADYYYGIDIWGNINYIYNSTGTVVVKYEYDAWGKILSTTGTLASTIGAINPYRYKSYYYDTETSLYYVSSRYYDPENGRWLNSDDVMFLGANGNIASYNLFAYCENNPINMVDLTGNIAANVIGAIIGGVIGAVGGAFLGKWLADRLEITGFWARAAFIGAVGLLVGAAAAAIGYFIGPYVAKAWSFWSAKLSGLIKETFKSIARITSEKMSHINVSKHLWNKVMKKVTKTQIETLIYQGIRKGTWNLLTNGSVKILYKYGGQIIVITGKVVNNIFQIGDAWVWNGIGMP